MIALDDHFHSPRVIRNHCRGEGKYPERRVVQRVKKKINADSKIKKKNKNESLEERGESKKRDQRRRRRRRRRRRKEFHHIAGGRVKDAIVRVF